MNYSLKQQKQSKKGARWKSLVGYTVKDLRNHLEKQFTEGMTWEVFMEGKIHVDHIIPLTAFNYKSTEDEEFKKCWSLENLQPLWAKHNISKSNKVLK